MQNMDSKNKLIGSIAWYHLYFHMAMFLEDPKRLEQQVTPENIEILQPHAPWKKSWEYKIDHTQETLPGDSKIHHTEKAQEMFQASLDRLCVGNIRNVLIIADN